MHDAYYDYSKVSYHNERTDVTIVCPLHGNFEQRPENHRRGSGCPSCARLGSRVTPSEFINRCTIIHDGKYDYSLCNYVVYGDPVDVICPTHGKFSVVADYHLHGTGCPKCSGWGRSYAENKISEFLTDHNIPHRCNVRDIIDGELDIVIDDSNIALEYCGLYWHSDAIRPNKNYHKLKLDACNTAGLRLVTIFEDEWINTPDIVKGRLLYALGLNGSSYYGRNCKVVELTAVDARIFLDRYHLQGFTGASIHLGLMHGETLVSVMSFSKPKRQTSPHQWELARFVSNGVVVGGASKLFSHFVSLKNPQTIVSFSDNRWYGGGVYTTLGFTHDGDIPPDYYYVKGLHRSHKSRYRKSRIAAKFGYEFTTNETERDAMRTLGYNRIYDCGKKRWIWKNE